jgi:hypothetical protein
MKGATSATVAGVALGAAASGPKVVLGKDAEEVLVTVNAGLDAVAVTPSASPIFTEPEKLALVVPSVV